MRVLLGGDDYSRHFRPCQKFLQVGGDEIGVCVLAERSSRFGMDITESEPFDTRMFCGENRPDPAHGSATNDRQPDSS
jgi:hypothetical protein